MNKRYMDFVPKTANKVTARPAVKKPVVEVDDFAVQEIFEEKPRKAGVSSGLKEPEYGVIEDFSDKFVKTAVEKRPLSTKAEKKTTAAEAKAKKITAKMPVFGKKSAAKATDETLEEAVRKAEQLDEKIEDTKVVAPVIPTAKFVNTEKVTKRPLSKNVYQKKIEVPEEEPSKPVTIIHKPEKDSRVGMVVTIILTIILGAAAGTVAFLLLPK